MKTIIYLILLVICSSAYSNEEYFIDASGNKIKRDVIKTDMSKKSPPTPSCEIEMDTDKKIEECISSTFTKYRNALNGIYNRYLRKNPSLVGEVVFEIYTDENSSTQVRVKSSKLEDDSLNQALVRRTKPFNFEKIDLKDKTKEIKIEFFPF